MIYGISEMQCRRIVTGLEKILLQSKEFHLLGKKALHGSGNNFEVIAVNVSEHLMERPKKTGHELFGQKEDTYSKEPDSGIMSANQ